MNLSIVNNSGVTKTYAGVVITNGSTVAVTNPVTQLALSTDGLLRVDIAAGLVFISDGTSQFSGPDAINYLYLIPSNIDALTYKVDTGGQNRAQTVTTTAAEALGGASRLSPRVFISVMPTNGTVYWGMTSGVTSTNGTPIFKNQFVVFEFTDGAPLYLVAATGSVDVRVTEGA